MEQQLNPQAITLLSPEQLSALAAERAKQVAARPKLPPPPPPPPKVAVAACLELGAFNPGEIARVRQVLEPLKLGPRLSQRNVQAFASYWVLTPPQIGRASCRERV